MGNPDEELLKAMVIGGIVFAIEVITNDVSFKLLIRNIAIGVYFGLGYYASVLFQVSPRLLCGCLWGVLVPFMAARPMPVDQRIPDPLSGFIGLVAVLTGLFYL